ncbi:hypothetical protein [Paenibacillus paeoniae]|uniref:hypothetical protein n=1 Tax=Paenibacillus paeoniae TaxID=2292705 RepID=UPI00105872AD|nr:hypothetical protein [Paenibacillus paeoniae]
MKQVNRQIVSDPDFERMRVFSQLIAVYRDNELLDANIRIVAHSEHSVSCDNDVTYIKANHQFYRL